MRAVFVAFIAVCAIGLAPGSAQACSIFGKAILSSLPGHGELDVATDVAPVLRGYFIPGSIEWRSADGRSVEFELTTHKAARETQGQVAELTPHEALEPNTRYVIRARMEGLAETEQLEFVTGEKPASSEPLATPDLKPLILTEFLSGCVGAAAIGCIETGAADTLIEVVDSSGTVSVRDVVSGDVTVHIPRSKLRNDPNNPSCLRAYTRSPSGRLSPAQELCGDALAKRPIRKGDIDFLTCTFGAPIRRDGGPDDAGEHEDEDYGGGLARFGCAAVAPRHSGTGPGSFGFAISIALAGIARRVRRGQRRTQ